MNENVASSLTRRLAAIIYDSFIVIGLLITATIIAVMINRGQIISPNNYLFTLYLISVIFIYFSYSWVKGKQTIGMRAWNLEIRTNPGEPMDYWRATMRFGFAIPSILLLGIGLWWMLIDRHKLSWYDRWSGSYLIYKK